MSILAAIQSHLQDRNLPLGCHSHTPLLAPQSHFHTPEGPTAEGKKGRINIQTTKDTHIVYCLSCVCECDIPSEVC